MRARNKRNSIAQRPQVPPTIAQNNDIDPRIDRDLTHDRLSLGITGTALVGNDGGVYDANSFLQILQNGGMSLVNPVVRLTEAFTVPAIQNTIDNLFGQHPDRNAMAAPATLAEIRQRLRQTNTHASGEWNASELINASQTFLESLETISAYMKTASGWALFVSTFTPLGGFTLLLGCLLHGDFSNRGVEGTIAKSIGIYVGCVGALYGAKLGLFAGKKMGIFEERARAVAAPEPR